MTAALQNGKTPVIPAVMRAAVCTKRGPDFTMELRYDYPTPSPQAGELLVKLSHTGLCMTDVHHMLGDLGLGASADCPGHEGAGVVVGLGPGTEADGWRIGDRVGVKPCKDTCGRCELCLEGYDLNCPKRVMSAYTTNGTYAQYLTHPARYISRIPEGLEDHLAAPILCAGATTYRALKVSGVKMGEWLVVTGAGGGVGSMAVLYARAAGIRVIGIDTSASKRDMCLNQLGCEAFVDFFECKDIPAEVQRITGRGAHGIIVTGGTKSAYEGWVEMLRIGGTLVCVGLPPKGTVFVGADPLSIIVKGLSIRGSLIANWTETDMALKIAAAGDVAPVVTVYPFEELIDAVQQLRNGKITGRAVVKFEE